MASSSSSSSSGYPYPSTLNPAGFISVKLTPDNYALWEAQMLCLLQSQDLVAFIESLPPNQEEEDYLLWVKSDRLVKGWIFGSLTDQVLKTVIYRTTARDVWKKLQDTYQDMAVDEQTKERYSKLDREVSSYLPLYKAALASDWDAAKPLLVDRWGNTKADTVITARNETALHIAVGSGKKSIHFVKELVKLMSKEALAFKDVNGKTALAIAAQVGNTEAAKILLQKNPELLHNTDVENDATVPLLCAAVGGYTDTLRYLMKHTKREDYFNRDLILYFFAYAIIGGFLDISLDFFALQPYTEDTKAGVLAVILHLLAGSVHIFRSGSNFNFAERLIYSCVPVKLKKNFCDLNEIDIENPTTNSQAQGVKKVLGCDHLLPAWQRLKFWVWKVIGLMVPRVKKIQQEKLDHHLAVQLVKCVCEEIKSLERDQDYFICTWEAITKAACLGTVEVIEEIVDILPCSVWSSNEQGRNIFQLAVMNRSEKVFNLLYQMSGFQHNLLIRTDKFNNNIVHMAGRLAPSHKLNRVSGAALQMQRELQWFKEVEKVLSPVARQGKNFAGETPAMVFTREHAELVIAGEKWIKDTSTSCTIAAALIVTVVFAAAITVPGGSSGDGHPVFSHGRAFKLFGFSNAISLFSSTTSLLMFLSILTARYAEQDFYEALPKRLIWGLFALFLSITTMIIAFSSATYLVFGDKKWWAIILLAAGSCLPVVSFIKLQFPLLVDVFRSTYGRGIFGKQSNRPFY